MRTSEQVLSVIKELIDQQPTDPGHPEWGKCDFVYVEDTTCEATGYDWHGGGRNLVDRIRERLPHLSKRQVVGAIGFLAKAKKLYCNLNDGPGFGPHAGLWAIISIEE